MMRVAYCDHTLHAGPCPLSPDTMPWCWSPTDRTVLAHPALARDALAADLTGHLPAGCCTEREIRAAVELADAERWARLVAQQEDADVTCELPPVPAATLRATDVAGVQVPTVTMPRPRRTWRVMLLAACRRLAPPAVVLALAVSAIVAWSTLTPVTVTEGSPPWDPPSPVTAPPSSKPPASREPVHRTRPERGSWPAQTASGPAGSPSPTAAPASTVTPAVRPTAAPRATGPSATAARPASTQTATAAPQVATTTPPPTTPAATTSEPEPSATVEPPAEVATCVPGVVILPMCP